MNTIRICVDDQYPVMGMGRCQLRLLGTDQMLAYIFSSVLAELSPGELGSGVGSRYSLGAGTPILCKPNEN